MRWSQLKRLAKDHMSIVRTENIKVNGITRPQKVEVCKDQLCKLSRTELKVTIPDKAATIEKVYKVICSPEIDIIDGDEVTIVRPDKTILVVIAGQVHLFPDSHKEFIAKIKDAKL